MSTHVWTVVCRRPITDHDTNNISLIDVLEQITVGERTQEQLKEGDTDRVDVHLSMCVASLWWRPSADTLEQFSMRVRILGPQNEELAEHSGDVPLEAGKRRVRTTIQSDTFPIVGPGDYWIVTESIPSEGQAWEEHVSVPIEVRFAESAQ